MKIIKQFQSVCADCGQPVPAAYVRHEDRVYLEKTCPEHGSSQILASEDAEVFERWIAFPSITVPPRIIKQKDNSSPELSKEAEEYMQTECPMHCGPCENHLMTACCVLINVTSLCNQHCPYCFANAALNDSETHFDMNAPGNDLADAVCADPPLAEIERWLERLIELGEERKFNIQISGGEPTVRDDLPDIIKMCKNKGFEYIQLNTNGRRLADSPDYAVTLKSAGLSTVFMQFDGMDDEIYIALRGEPLLDIKKAAIQNCAAAGLPVSLVPTVLKSTVGQIGAILDFMLENTFVIKGVHFQPASFFGRRPDERNEDGDFDERVTMFAVMNEIEKQTGSCIKRDDLAPISTGHPLCCFCASFVKEKTGEIRPVSSGGSCCDSDDTNNRVVSNPLEIIRRDRDFVLNKWDVHMPENGSGNETCCGSGANAAMTNKGDALLYDTEEPSPCVPYSTEEPSPCVHNNSVSMSFDEAIAFFKTNSFTISGMAFMDETNLDAERLRRCRVQVFTPDERLVPFCGYYVSF